MLGGHVPQIDPQRRYRLRSRTEGAVGEQTGIKTDHLVAGSDQAGHRHTAEVSLVAGNENTDAGLQSYVGLVTGVILGFRSTGSSVADAFVTGSRPLQDRSTPCITGSVDAPYTGVRYPECATDSDDRIRHTH